MDSLTGVGAPEIWLLAVCITLFGGVVKGVVGFAMPMIVISGLASVMPPEVALAGLILPTLAANLWQALRQGRRAAWETMRRYRVFLGALTLAMLASAQLVPVLPASVLFAVLGVPITLHALVTLAGHGLRLAPDPGPRTEAGIGAVTGFIGGMSGVWGPITVAMLTAQDIAKSDHIRIQGVIYGLGAVVLVVGHLGSGVLNRETLVFSSALVLPGLIGMALGFRLQDRVDQATFRRLTLIVLLVAGLNLIRRALVAG